MLGFNATSPTTEKAKRLLWISQALKAGRISKEKYSQLKRAILVNDYSSIDPLMASTPLSKYVSHMQMNAFDNG